MARKRPFRIGRSRTGLGLFATGPIRKRSRIVEYKGRKLPNAAAEKLEARGNRYLYEINSRWTIDGSTRRNLGRYANHSCRPNAESYQVGHRVFLRAIKNIKSGDEITYDYGTDYLNNVITNVTNAATNGRWRARGCELRRGGSEGARAERLRKRASEAAARRPIIAGLPDGGKLGGIGV